VGRLAIVERVTDIHKMVNGLTKHNFEFQFNRDIHSHQTRRRDNLRCSDGNPILKQATNEYNLFCDHLRHLTCIKTFKAKLKIEVMKTSSDFNVISPYFYLN